eukprot:7041458-Alexandrium_andersonii.AAC.1
MSMRIQLMTTIIFSLPGGGGLRPPGPPQLRSPACFVGRFGTCANESTECTRPEHWGPMLRPLLGLH